MRQDPPWSRSHRSSVLYPSQKINSNHRQMSTYPKYVGFVLRLDRTAPRKSVPPCMVVVEPQPSVKAIVATVAANYATGAGDVTFEDVAGISLIPSYGDMIHGVAVYMKINKDDATAGDTLPLSETALSSPE